MLLLGFVTVYGIFFTEYSWPERLAGSVCVSCFLLLVNALKPHAFGMGDVKLIAVSGMALGFSGSVVALAIAFVTAGICCVVGMLIGKIDRKSNIPLGPFLSLGIGICLIISRF